MRGERKKKRKRRGGNRGKRNIVKSYLKIKKPNAHESKILVDVELVKCKSVFIWFDPNH